MFMVRLRNNEGWVVVPFSDMIYPIETQYFEEDDRWLVFYDPEQYPPFAAYTGIVIPNKHVHVHGKNNPQPEWDYYKELVNKIYSQ